MEKMEKMENTVQTNERIKTFIDNMFASLPQNDQSARIKEDMYCSMQDKYNALVESGATEDEAFGKTVSEFGSVEDIRAELGANAPHPSETVGTSTPEKLTLPVSKETERGYEKYKVYAAVLIAVAVVLFIVAAVGYDSYDTTFINLSLPQLTNFVFGSAIAVGVMLCVKAVTGREKFFDMTRETEYDVLPSTERVESYRKFAGVRSWLMGLAVGIFVISPFVNELTGSDLLFGLIIAAGVAILIILSAARRSFKDVLGKDFDKEEKD